MSDPEGTDPAPGGGRATALWGSAIAFAVVAIGVLVITDESRWLRLGVVAALWAALLAAFAVAKLRNRVAENDDRADELQRTYELELEREVAARREFELETEQEIRERVERESRYEIESLRTELRNLRESLEQIVGGDVLFERVALRAESTRVRSLPESGSANATGGQPANPVIDQRQQRGRELTSAQPASASAGQPGPSQAMRPGDQSNTELVNRLSGAGPPSRPAAQQDQPQYGEPRYSAAQYGEPRYSEPSSRPRQEPVQRHTSGQPPPRPGPQYVRPAGNPPVQQPTSSSQAARPGPSTAQPPPTPAAQPHQSAIERQAVDQPSYPRPAQPRRTSGQQYSRPQPRGAEDAASPAPESSHQPAATENQPTFAPAPSANTPAQTDPEARGEHTTTARRRAAAQAAFGAHTEGTSVNELLAAYGTHQESRRNRRRRD